MMACKLRNMDTHNCNDERHTTQLNVCFYLIMSQVSIDPHLDMTNYELICRVKDDPKIEVRKVVISVQGITIMTMFV